MAYIEENMKLRSGHQQQLALDVTGPWDGRAYACSCTEISSGTGHGLLTDDCLLLLLG